MSHQRVDDRPDIAITQLIERYMYEHNTDFNTALQRVVTSPDGSQLFDKYNRAHCYRVGTAAAKQSGVNENAEANVDDEVRNRVCAVLRARCGLSFDDALQEVLLADPNLAVRYSEYVAATPRLGTRNV